MACALIHFDTSVDTRVSKYPVHVVLSASVEHGRGRHHGKLGTPFTQMKMGCNEVQNSKTNVNGM
ncbi:hypothetical protein KC19_VG273500 [Ceratodon purpureus]|uniref:Uncharacterized protein n=1 Tax=Ceratodon purpureus TaxID=3225 RepID=A0A8T0HU74_CERPU|nr:hypothetical protein KC19_VG273500 [Ceratodon purpureus]